MTARLRFGLDRNLAFLFWGLFFTQLAWGASDRFRPIFIESLGASTALVGVILGISELFRLVGLVLSGPLSDRASPRLLIGGGRSLIILSAGTYLVAQEYWHLFPAFVIGALGNVAWPAISRVIADATNDATRARSFLLIYSIGPGIAGLGAPLAGGFIADAFGLRAVFAITTVGVATAAFFFVMVAPPPAPPATSARARYIDVLRHRPTFILCLLALSIMFSTYVGLTLAPNYLHDIHAISLRAVGQFFSLVAVGSIVAGLLISRRPRLGRPLNGLLATTLFLPLVFLLLVRGNASWLFGLAFFCYGVAAVAGQMFYAALGDASPERLRTRAFALLEVMTSLGYVLAGFAAGALYGIDPALPLWTSFGASLALIVAVLFVRRYLAAVRAEAPAAGFS